MSSRPKYNVMVAEAITALKKRNGASRQAIKSTIEGKYNFDANAAALRTAIRTMVESGHLEQIKQSFKLTDVGKAALKKATAPKKPKKKAAPKKKPAAKKARSKSKAATKTKSKSRSKSKSKSKSKSTKSKSKSRSKSKTSKPKRKTSKK
jgi:histone H1/5